ncbi:hypothetical protein [Bacillus sp. FJAT-27445]|uniref:hypothetical protein n=1 Tax=Bacillus sp. FJAT-27445 TaxID=1679166 RepID=UPI00074422B2|nr:hypothetical protein [Bacillus sp. FJAT-27445]
MAYVVGSFLFIAVSVILMKKFHVREPFTKGAGLFIVIGLLANISLAENIAANLHPEQNDGLAISKGIATWILGDDGGIMEDFRAAFQTSMNYTLGFLVLFVIIAIIEARFLKNKRQGN